MITENKEEIGQSIVTTWLKYNGYFKVNRNKHFVEADANRRSIVVMVKVLSPEKNSTTLSKLEKTGLLNIAQEHEREAWAAYVMLNEDGEVAESINWENLSKKT